MTPSAEWTLNKLQSVTPDLTLPTDGVSPLVGLLRGRRRLGSLFCRLNAVSHQLELREPAEAVLQL